VVDCAGDAVFAADHGAQVGSSAPQRWVGRGGVEGVAEVLVGQLLARDGGRPGAEGGDAGGPERLVDGEGTTTAGTPAVKAAPVVPAPPWCTTAAICG
jgi:hypothetical protein